MCASVGPRATSALAAWTPETKKEKKNFSRIKSRVAISLVRGACGVIRCTALFVVFTLYFSGSNLFWLRSRISTSE